MDARCPVYVRNAFSQILSLAQQGASGMCTCIFTLYFVCICLCVCVCVCVCVFVYILCGVRPCITYTLLCMCVCMCVFCVVCVLVLPVHCCVYVYIFVDPLHSHRAADHYQAVPPM